jgi:hypothetical protein
LTLSTALADWHLDSNRTNSGTFSISDGTDVRVTIDSTGNVGIGTAAVPRLHAYTSTQDEVARFESTGNPYISLYDTGTRQGYFYSNASSVELVSENSKPLYLQGATEIRLRTNTSTDRVIINSGGVVGVNYTPPITTSVSKLMVDGDITLANTNRSLLGNLYYDTAVPDWKYAANGYGWGFREDNAGKLQMVRAGNNTSGANATASISLTDLFTFDLVNNRVGLGTASPATKLHVHNGNIRVSSGYGIDFSLTADATGGSGISEVLDDYEEGAWTPTLWSDNTKTAEYTSYDSRKGNYVKVGKQVFVSWTWIPNAKFGTGNYLYLNDLPFPIDGNGDNFTGTWWCQGGEFAASANGLGGTDAWSSGGGATWVELTYHDSLNGQRYVGTDFTHTLIADAIYGTFIYVTDS